MDTNGFQRAKWQATEILNLEDTDRPEDRLRNQFATGASSSAAPPLGDPILDRIPSSKRVADASWYMTGPPKSSTKTSEETRVAQRQPAWVVQPSLDPPIIAVPQAGVGFWRSATIAG